MLRSYSQSPFWPHYSWLWKCPSLLGQKSDIQMLPSLLKGFIHLQSQGTWLTEVTRGWALISTTTFARNPCLPCAICKQRQSSAFILRRICSENTGVPLMLALAWGFPEGLVKHSLYGKAAWETPTQPPFPLSLTQSQSYIMIWQPTLPGALLIFPLR